MSRVKYSDEFKARVVREIVENDRTIASVSASYDLPAQRSGELGGQVPQGSLPPPRMRGVSAVSRLRSGGCAQSRATPGWRSRS